MDMEPKKTSRIGRDGSITPSLKNHKNARTLDPQTLQDSRRRQAVRANCWQTPDKPATKHSRSASAGSRRPPRVPCAAAPSASAQCGTGAVGSGRAPIPCPGCPMRPRETRPAATSSPGENTASRRPHGRRCCWCPPHGVAPQLEIDNDALAIGRNLQARVGEQLPAVPLEQGQILHNHLDQRCYVVQAVLEKSAKRIVVARHKCWLVSVLFFCFSIQSRTIIELLASVVLGREEQGKMWDGEKKKCQNSPRSTVHRQRETSARV